MQDKDTPPLHAQVYDEMRHALIVGRLHPGNDMSLRGLAREFNVGVMPVREAVRRLAGEGALEISSTRRISVPRMTTSLFEELMLARLLLEPECAARALSAIDAATLKLVRSHDDALNASLRDGNPEAYMLANYAFHFAIYRAAPSAVFTPLIDRLWLRFGPFMRMVYGQWGTATLVDQHACAIDAITRGDPDGLRVSIEADISDGMRLLGRAVLSGHDLPGRIVSVRLRRGGTASGRSRKAS